MLFKNILTLSGVHLLFSIRINRKQKRKHFNSVSMSDLEQSCTCTAL